MDPDAMRSIPVLKPPRGLSVQNAVLIFTPIQCSNGEVEDSSGDVVSMQLEAIWKLRLSGCISLSNCY